MKIYAKINLLRRRLTLRSGGARVHPKKYIFEYLQNFGAVAPADDTRTGCFRPAIFAPAAQPLSAA